MADLIEPKEIEITTPDGKVWKYTISKFPAFDGREICTQYPLTALPKIGEYAANEVILLKMMNYVSVKTTKEGSEQRLSTKELINNHVPGWEILAQVELELMQYNCSFFFEGRSSIFLKGLAEKLHPFLTSILTASLAQLSQTNKQPSMN